MTGVRRRGRDARKAARLAETGPDWLPPLERGLPSVEPVSAEQVERIHDASMDVIEEIGVDFRDDIASDMWREAGAKVEGHRVRIDREHLMEIISTAPEEYTMIARNRDRSVTLGKNRTIFTPAYGAPYVQDLDGVRRYATLEDFDNFAKLAYLMPAMHMTGGVLCEPMDIPVPKRHLHMIYSLMKHSDKPFMGSVTSGERAEDTMAMAGILFGEDFVRDNTVMTCLANANTPLVWDKTMLDHVRVYASHNQAVLFSPFVLGGASTAANTLASVVQVNIEALTGVAFHQLVRPGAPAVYGRWLSTVSMKSGAPQSGTPEIDHMNMVTGQMARRYKLPWRCSGMCSSSKAVDAQAGYESARNMYGVLMAGANFVLSTTGYLEGALCQSYSKAALDGEQMEMFYRLGQGVSFDGFDDALAAMREVPPGGYFLGTAHTLANFQEAFVMPELMNSDNYEQWESEGSLDAYQRGLAKASDMLERYEEPFLPDDIDEALRDFIGRRESELPDMVT